MDRQPEGVPLRNSPGADLIADITVSSVAGVRSVSASVKRFQAGQFVEVTDSRIRADVVTLLEAFDVDVSGEEFPAGTPQHFWFPQISCQCHWRKVSSLALLQQISTRERWIKRP